MQLATQRLILRDFVLDDWPAVLTDQQDPRYLRFYPWPERGEDDVRAFVGMFLEQQTERPRRRVLERLGFQPEGRLRQNEYFKGRWWDTLLYALLRDEWENLELYQALDREPS